MVQEVAIFLKQCGQDFIDVGRILASIGGTCLQQEASYLLFFEYVCQIDVFSSFMRGIIRDYSLSNVI